MSSTSPRRLSISEVSSERVWKCRERVAFEVTRRMFTPSTTGIRLLTSAATIPLSIHALRSEKRSGEWCLPESLGLFQGSCGTDYGGDLRERAAREQTRHRRKFYRFLERERKEIRCRRIAALDPLPCQRKPLLARRRLGRFGGLGRFGRFHHCRTNAPAFASSRELRSLREQSCLVSG